MNGDGEHRIRGFYSSVYRTKRTWPNWRSALGSVSIVVATTGAFVLSVLRPAWGKFISPLINHSFAESYWAIWLPAGASAFNVVLMKRFFDNLPRELFEAAKIDGAGPVRLFFSIVLPLSKLILGVVSVFAILAEWKNFLWPLLVSTNSPDRQPLSVRLPAIQPQTQIGVLLAPMLIASLVPLIGFLVFQRTFLRGTGLGGALKG
jgi:multiple sugar transport system permease protein